MPENTVIAPQTPNLNNLRGRGDRGEEQWYSLTPLFTQDCTKFTLVRLTLHKDGKVCLVLFLLP